MRDGSLATAFESLSVRTVKPREPKHHRPLVIAADESYGVLIECRSWDDARNRFTHPSVWWDAFAWNNQVIKWIPWQSLHVILPMLPADTIVVTVDDLGLVKMLSGLYDNDWLRAVLCPDDFDRFEFSLSEEERDVAFAPDLPRITTTVHRVLHAGFKRKGRNRGHWYRVISAPKFLAASTLRNHKWSLLDMLRFGQIAADFCRDTGVPLGASAGATASKLLRLPRYYPEPRRRVPRATNEAARPALRGHAYKLFVEPMKPITAVEFDQSSAHPNAAATIPMPQADRLYAGYSFTNLEQHRQYLWRGHSRFEREIQRPGLFFLKLYGPTRHSEFCPREWCREGPFTDYVTSNEVEWLRELGIGVDGIIARWTSPVADEGIKAYAEDALSAGQSLKGMERAIVKAIFLAGLGVLGAKPHNLKVLRGHEIDGGDVITVPTRSGPLTIYRKEMKNTYQLAIANLIQRAMVERECAKRSWRFAASLAAEGWDIACIYADSVFAIPPGAQMSLTNVPAPWRERAVHTNLQFKTATTYVSDQAAKMPGVPRFGGGERERMRQRWQTGVASVR